MTLLTRVQLACAVFVCLCSLAAFGQEEVSKIDDKELAADLNMLQGSWELMHGKTRSVKTIEGNKETLRRYDAKTGELRSEHSVTFELSKSGAVRVFTFYLQPGGPSMSFVYKVDKDNFYDIPGLLHGDKFRNYQKRPSIWHWKRLAEDDAKSSTSNED